MHSLTGTVNYVYPKLIRTILACGAEVPSRNGMTRELHPCVLEIHNPRHRLVTSLGRPVNVAFALAEVLWILAGRSDVEMLKFYNRRIDTWSDDGASFNAPYGHRLRSAHGHDQLDDVIRTLRADPGSRQAVLNVWHPPSDRGWEPRLGGEPVPHKTADRACNMLSHLMIRDGVLDWMHIVRSNDAIWGVPYNFMQWMHLQEYLAEMVGVPVGRFFHMVDSMHIYSELVPGTMDVNQPGVGGESRWDEAEGISSFDLYAYTGVGHAPMGRTDNDVLSSLMRTEHMLRTQAITPNQSEHLIHSANVGPYWSNVLSVLYAHRMYIEGKDAMAMHQLVRCSDPVLALAQIRFYMHMRWSKKDVPREAVRFHFQDPVLWRWLMGAGSEA